MTSPAENLRPLRASTRVVEPSDRFDAWRESVAGLFDVERPAAGEFQVDTATWHFDELLLVQARHSARKQSRTARSIRSEPVDHYRVILQHQGNLRLDADGQRLLLTPRRVAITDMARPESFDTDAGASTVLIVPREALDRALQRPVDLHGVVADGPAGAMLAEHMVRLAHHAPMLNRREALPMARATIQLLAGAFATPADDVAVSSAPTLLRQACRFIDRHLGNPDLAADALLAEFNMSRTSLYRMFEPLGGVSKYILERRLVRVHDQLAEADRIRHLGRLAEAHGFRDTTHFSKAFRRMFGYSPSELRQNAPATPARYALAGEPPEVVRDWLRKLRV